MNRFLKHASLRQGVINITFSNICGVRVSVRVLPIFMSAWESTKKNLTCYVGSNIQEAGSNFKECAGT